MKVTNEECKNMCYGIDVVRDFYNDYLDDSELDEIHERVSQAMHSLQRRHPRQSYPELTAAQDILLRAVGPLALKVLEYCRLNEEKVIGSGLHETDIDLFQHHVQNIKQHLLESSRDLLAIHESIVALERVVEVSMTLTKDRQYLAEANARRITARHLSLRKPPARSFVPLRRTIQQSHLVTA